MNISIKRCIVAALSLPVALSTISATAQNTGTIEASKQRVVDRWTATRRASAIPRDLVIDSRGLGYMRRPDGTLQSYGHQISATAPNNPTPMIGRPSSNKDTTPPDISGMSPSDGATIGAAQMFSAVVTDASGVKSVTFNLQSQLGATESFPGSSSDGVNWSVTLQGFADLEQWDWWVTATDNVSRGGNTADSAVLSLTVETAAPVNGGGYIVTNDTWATASAVKSAAGRIFFEMPRNSKMKGPWTAYVCSGTVATDGTTGRSVIITAAHCVYDDVNNAFARNILFIPNQHDTTGSGTDSNCDNDPIGCWVPTFGAVDVNWATRIFPDNIAWDYAYYVVEDSGAHRQGAKATTDVLDVEAGSLKISFGDVYYDDLVDAANSTDFTHALGYSLSDDPNFMYCAEDMTKEGTVNWWLPNCALSGGASGGPWVQPMSSGSGPIMSINSWGYVDSPGMAGPKLVGTSASCVFEEAKKTDSSVLSDAPDGLAGIRVTCPPPP